MDTEFEFTLKQAEVIAGSFDSSKGELESKMQAILEDNRFTDEHKAEQISALGADLADYTTERIEGILTKLEGAKAALEKESYVSPVPPAEQLAQLSYAREALTAAWANMAPQDMIADWKRALDAGDLITARVYRDIGRPLITEKYQKQQVGAYHGPVDIKKLPLPNDLVKQTTDALVPSSAKNAAEKLKAVESQIVTLQRLKARSEMFRSYGIDRRTRQITNRVLDQISQSFRRTW